MHGKVLFSGDTMNPVIWGGVMGGVGEGCEEVD